jgi:hypothetical protein
VADWNGSVPQVTYTVTDGRSNGLTTTLDITVTPVDDLMMPPPPTPACLSPSMC